ncbi:hypothetical protein ACJIZ3_019568 [Penstemon smallii]|uniref:Integrase catalytic domain-containing protein n=1 Tax=Penstemon smallii TaxID=265156 RepID=A0ABD3T1I6_9LAMI
MDPLSPFNMSAAPPFHRLTAIFFSLLFIMFQIFQKNLISVQNFCNDNKVFFEFHSHSFYVKDSKTRTILLQGPTRNGLYVFPTCSSSPQINMSVRATPSLWHNRLGHPSMQLVNRIINQVMLPVSKSTSKSLCSACCQGKMHQQPYTPSLNHSTAPLQLLFADVWGPSPVLSRGGYRYYLSIVDDFSRFCWIFPLKSKSEVVNTFLLFKKNVENLLHTNICSFQSDWGGEFRSLQPILRSFGITHRISCPYAHSQNGMVERKHRHIVETGLALLSHSSLPKKFWSDSFITAVYLINRLPSPLLKNVSPFEILFKKKPNYLFLKTFGCQCWPNLRPYNKHKIDFRSIPCIFLGYSPSHHGYLCYHVATSRMYISRDVIFDETNFPYSKNQTSIKNESTAPSYFPFQFPTQTGPINTITQSQSPITQLNQTHNSEGPSNVQPNTCTTSPNTNPNPTPYIDPSHNPPNSPDLGPQPEYPEPDNLTIDPNSTLNLDTISSSPTATSHQFPTSSSSRPYSITTRSQTNSSRPKSRKDGTIPWPPPRAHLTENSIPEEPSSFTQASKFSDWRSAMQQEFDALMNTKTWSLIPPSPGQNLIGCKWIFKTKFRSDGSIERRKARLVAKGYNQLEGLDYNETFSPVVKPTSIRLVLSIATSLNWPITQLDVQNAFLHGSIDESVYMSQPPGFVHPDYPNYVCKLNRALYGLKQAPRAWYARLSSRLIELGFLSSKSDASLFIYRNGAVVIYLLVYVDDIVLTGSSSHAMEKLISLLCIDFPVKNLGGLNYFLGLECSRSPSGLLITQKKYILDLLRRTNMADCKPVHSPMATSTRLSAYDSPNFEDPTLYRSVVGSLQYLLFTRPDLAFSVNKVCQYMHSPRVSHWQCVKRILRYLKSTADFGLLLQPSPNPCLAAFTDADWAGCLDDRKSTGGFCIFFGKNLVSWSSKKQSTIARSSTEAEYKALAHATCEVLWIQSLMTELGILSHTPPTLYCDNLGATYLSKNPILHYRTKHVDIDYHFVRDRVQAKALRVSFLSSKDQLADILTKPLSTSRFSTLRTSLAVLPPQLDSRGHVNNTSKQPIS